MAGAPDWSSAADPGGVERWAAEAEAEARGSVGNRRWRARVGARLRVGPRLERAIQIPRRGGAAVAAGRLVRGGASGARRSGGRGRCTGRGAERRCEEL